MADTFQQQMNALVEELRQRFEDSDESAWIRAAVGNYLIQNFRPGMTADEVVEALDLEGDLVEARRNTETQRQDDVREQVTTAAEALGDVAATGTEEEVQSALGELFSGLNLQQEPPAAVVQLFGGQVPSEEELVRVIGAYNRLNPGAPIDPSNINDLYLRIESGDPWAFTAVAQALEGETTAFMNFRVFDPTLRQMVEVPVRSDQYLAVAEAMPGSEGFLPAVVSVGYRLSPDVPWQILASAANLMGAYGKPGADRRAQRQRQQEFERMSGEESAVDESDPLTSGTITEQTSARMGELVQRYNDYGLALIALKNEDLANAIYERGFALPDEVQTVQQIFLDAGYDPERLAAAGVAVDVEKFQAALGKDSSGGPVQVQLPDRAQLDNGVRSLWRSWFQRDPSEQELEGFSKEIEALILGRAEQQEKALRGNVFKGITPGKGVVSTEDVNPEARLLDRARSTAEYGRLFGRKQEGVTEEEYVGQFRGASAALLGGVLGPSSAIRAGMETGDVQTTIGSVAASPEARGNSTFLQRIARSAQTIAGLT